MNCAKNCLPTASSFARGDCNEDALHAVVLRHLEDQGVTPEVVQRLRHELEAPTASVANPHAVKSRRSKGKGELLRLFGYATEGPFLRVGSCVLAGWIVCLVIEALAQGLRVEAAALGGAISVAGAAVLAAAWIAARRGHSAVTRLFCAWVIFYSLMLAGCLARAALWEHMTASVLVVVLLLVLALLSQPFRLWGSPSSVRAKSSDDTNGVGNGVLPTARSESPAAPPKTVTTPSPPRESPVAVLPSSRSSSPRPPPSGQPQLLVNKIIGALDLDPWDRPTNGQTNGDVLATSQVARFSLSKGRRSNSSLRSGSPLPGKGKSGKQDNKMENGVQHKASDTSKRSMSGDLTSNGRSGSKSEATNSFSEEDQQVLSDQDADADGEEEEECPDEEDHSDGGEKEEIKPRSSILKHSRLSSERVSISVGGVLMDLSKETEQEAGQTQPMPKAPPRAPPVSRGVSFSLDEDNDLLAALADTDSRITSRRCTAVLRPQDLPEDFNSGQRVSFSRENKMIDLQPQYYSDEEDEDNAGSLAGPASWARHAPRFSVVCTSTTHSSSESSTDEDEVEEDHDEDDRQVKRTSDDWDSNDDEEHAELDAGRALTKATRGTATAAAKALKKIASRAHDNSSSSSSSECSDSSDAPPPVKKSPSLASAGRGRRATTAGPMKPKGKKPKKEDSEDEEEQEEDGVKSPESDTSSDKGKAKKIKSPPPPKGEKTKSKKKKAKKKKKIEGQPLLRADELKKAFEANLGKPFMTSYTEKERLAELREALGMRSQYTLPAQELLEKLSRISRHDSDAGLGLMSDGNIFGSGGTSQDEFNRMREAVAGQMLLEDMMSSSRRGSALLEVPNGVPNASSDERRTSGSQQGSLWGTARRSTLELPNGSRHGSFAGRTTLGLAPLSNSGSRRASANVSGIKPPLSPLPETDESLLNSSPTSPRRSIGNGEEGSQQDQAMCTPCGDGLGLPSMGISTARRPSSPHRSDAAVAPGLLTKVLCGNPAITLQELVQTDLTFAAMPLQELIKRAGDEGLYAGEPAKPFGNSIVRRDSLNEMGINLDSAFVQQMLTMLNGGQAPQKCNCKPGMPHSCMSPAASAFASLAATVSHTVSATVQATAQVSRRTSVFKGDKSAAAKKEESESEEDDSSDGSISTDSEGTAFGPCDSVGSTSSWRPPPATNPHERPRPPALTILNSQKGSKGVEAASSKDFSPPGKDLLKHNSPGGKGTSSGVCSPSSPSSPTSPATKARGSNVAEAGWLGDLRDDHLEQTPKGGNPKKGLDSADTPDSPAAGVRRKNSRDGDTEIGAGRLNLGALEPASEQDNQTSDTDELAVSVEDQGSKSALKGSHSICRTRNQSMMSVYDSAPSKQTSHTELAQPEDLSEMDGEVFTRVPPEELAFKIACGHVQVIDVRGRDFKGGHIPGCANMRTSSILDNPASVLDMCSNRENEVKDIVFTCMYSKLRAPRCASAVARQLQRSPGNYSSSFVVSILQGGMHGWVNHWHKKNMPAEFGVHVQDFDSAIWQDCADVGRSEGQLFTYGLVHSMDAVWSEGGQKELALALEDALRDRLRRVSDPDAQDVIAVQKVDPCLMSPKMSMLKRSMSSDSDSRKSDLRHRETLERRSFKRSGSGASVASRADSIVSQGRLEQDSSAMARRKSLGGQSNRFSVISVPEDNVLDADIESETECSDSSDESYSASD